MIETPDAIRRNVTVPLSRTETFALFVDRIGAWWHSRRARAGFRPASSAPGSAQRVRIDRYRGGSLWQDEARIGGIDIWDPGRWIVLTLDGPARQMEGRVTIRFAEVEGGTRIELVHEGWAPVLDAAVPLADAIGYWLDDPWKMRLGKLVRLSRPPVHA